MNREDDKIKKKYLEKVKLLKKHNALYYSKDSPTISDSDFDKIKKELIILEQKHKYLKKYGSVAAIVGAPLTNKFKKIDHSKPMLSLSNAFDKNDMHDFLKKIKNYLNLKDLNIQLISEPKIDGISASLTYENGVLTKGLSRGDGKTGEDILQNLMTIEEIPKKIEDKNVPKVLEVRGEVFIGKKDFEKIKKKFCKPSKCCRWITKTKKS